MWGDGLYFTNLKVSKAETTVAKIDSENKFVTNAIYFGYTKFLME